MILSCCWTIPKGGEMPIISKYLCLEVSVTSASGGPDFSEGKRKHELFASRNEELCHPVR